MSDIPSQDELNADTPRWQQRPKSYWNILRAIHVWYASRRLGWPLTWKQALEVVEDCLENDIKLKAQDTPDSLR